MKLTYRNKVKILGDEKTLNENILNFVTYMKQTDSIHDYSECEICFNDSCEQQAKEILDFLNKYEISINLHKTPTTGLSFRFKDYDLIAYCHKMPEPEELKEIHSWSALFEDGKILIPHVEVES
ncbi:MAG: hypothetical protein K6A43_07385 [Treponema sp.]|nr:hypothetical protein [Treponema sp.]